MLTSTEERALLRQYHTCPLCKKPWPRQFSTPNCPTCGTIIAHTAGGKSPTCTTCSGKVPTTVIPKSCPSCGSSRNSAPRQKLIEGNLRFVMRTAKKYTGNPDYLQKLISAGNVGLVIAVDRFDIVRNSRFLTYAAWWIIKEILDEMSSSSSPVHVPAYLQKQLRKEAREGLYVCINCGIHSQDVHGHTGLPGCCDASHEFQLPISDASRMLSSPLPLDNIDLRAPEDTFLGVLEQRTGKYLRRVLTDMSLGQRDRFIVLGFFDAPAGDRKNGSKKLPQLAEITGITTERVRQIKERIIRKLRVELKKRKIESVLDAY